MAVVVSIYFRKISFPFQGKITMIDQLTFLPNSSKVTGSIPLIHGSSISLQNIGVGLLKDPSLMGTFALPPPSNLETCHMISSTSSKIKKNSDHFDSVDHCEVLPPSPTIPTSSDDQFSDVVHYLLRALEPDLSFMTPYGL